MFEEAVSGGGLGPRILSVGGICALEGGLSLLVGGQIVGGIGISGMKATQDGQVAAAGTNALQYLMLDKTDQSVPISADAKNLLS